MPVPGGELHRVLHVDGIRVARELVVLICCSGERVVSPVLALPKRIRTIPSRTATSKPFQCKLRWVT